MQTQVSQTVKLAEHQHKFEGYHLFEGCKPNALFLRSRYPLPKSLPSG